MIGISQTIGYDERWESQPGIGRFARELRSRLPDLVPLPLSGRATSPWDCVRLGFKLWNSRQAFFSPGYNAPLTLPKIPICPFVFTIHDLIFVKYRAEASWAKRQYFQHVIRPATHRAFKVLTVSQYSKREILEWSGLPENRVQVIYNGVGPTFTPAGTRRQAPDYLLYVGNQRPHKNVDSLLQAWTKVRTTSPIQLALSGTATEHTAALITRLGLAERVQFLGRLTDDQLAEAYRGAVATVMPSHYEGFGLPVIESMACGTPVVCSNATSLPEVAGDAALLVEPTVDGLVSGLQKVLDDAQLRERLSRRGIARATSFTWDAAAKQLASVLDELAESISPRTAVEQSARATVL